jgi:hypothetical protein
MASPQQPTTQQPALKPLAISCTSTDCDQDLHCFLQKKKRGDERRHPGPCRACGADLVQWSRVQKRSLKDVKYTFDALSKEMIRHEFWHRQFDEDAINHARRKGRVRLKEAIGKRLRSSIGKAENAREGRQTPFTGNVIYYAQHALACCCRKCLDYWHGIEPGRPLSDDEIAYFTALVHLYIERRLPWLPNEPEQVPRRRRKAA